MLIYCEICKKEFESHNSFARHLFPKHDLLFREYILQYKYNNIIPICNCGCKTNCEFNVAKKDYNLFVHGHHAIGRIKTDDEKKRIGLKNSINMKKYFHENPDKAIVASRRLRGGITECVEKQRINATKLAYANMSIADKKKFVDNTKNLWKFNHDKMMLAVKKASEKFKLNYKNNIYDFSERNSKLSIIISNKFVEGTFKWAKGIYKPKKCSNRNLCNYRSSWELTFMEILDNNSYITAWEYEPFFIEYKYNDVIKRYIPDFLISTVSNKKYLIEVKPAKLHLLDINKAKCRAAVEFCKKNNYEFMFWSIEEDFDVKIKSMV